MSVLRQILKELLWKDLILALAFMAAGWTVLAALIVYLPL